MIRYLNVEIYLKEIITEMYAYFSITYKDGKMETILNRGLNSPLSHRIHEHIMLIKHYVRIVRKKAHYGK